MPNTEKDDYNQLPGLYRLWDLQLIFNRTDEFQIFYVDQTEEGTPLFAVFRRQGPDMGRAAP